MAKQSSYALQQEAEKLEYMQVAERIAHQFDMDTCHVALNRCKEAWGWQRIKEFQDVWDTVKEEYKPLLTRGPEQDVAAEHLYRELCRIGGKHQCILTHDERYPDLRKPDYRGRQEKRAAHKHKKK